MCSSKATRIVAVACLGMLLSAGTAWAASHCAPVGGSFMTDVGGFGDNTTLGTVSGDLKGAIGVQILGITTGSGGTITIKVQHHLVTETGDMVFIDQAEAHGVFVASGLVGLTDYKMHLSGGSGRYAGAHGDMTAIGEADFNTGQIIGRYTGQICTVATGTP